MYLLYKIGGTILVGILTIFLAVIWYFRRNIDRWKELGIKKHWNLGDCFHAIMKINKKNTWDLDCDFYQQYGRVYGGFFLFQPIIFIAEPNIMKDILVKDFASFPNRRPFLSGNEMMDSMMSNVEGDDWKRIRSIVSPTFSSGKLRKMAILIEEAAKNLSENVLEVMQQEKCVDFKRYAGTFTMDVITTVAFGTKINSYRDPNNPFVTHARMFFSRNFSLRILLAVFFPNFCKKYKIAFSPETTKYFIKVTKEIIKGREANKTGEKPVDFLQMLLDAEHNTEEKNVLDSHYELGEETYKEVFGSAKSKKMSINEVIGQCVLFFIAGYDTTASTMSFMAYELALNPDKQKILMDEIDEAFENNEILDADVCNRLHYLDCVISETLRLYPPATRLERKAAEDYKIESLGITVPKGMFVNFPTYAMHRDPQWYPEPEKFQPERFFPENKAKRNPYVYLPFGAGPRNCVGMRFALLEAKMAMAHLLRRVEFYRVPETKVPMQYFNGTTLLSPLDITLGIRSRFHD